MDVYAKIGLSLLLFLSAGLLLYPQINSFLQNGGLRNDSQDQLFEFEQIVGFFVLFFVILWIIWAIPNTEKRGRTNSNLARVLFLKICGPVGI
jgi:hypothetical protein